LLCPAKVGAGKQAKAVNAGLKKKIARMDAGDIILNCKKDYRSREFASKRQSASAKTRSLEVPCYLERVGFSS